MADALTIAEAAERIAASPAPVLFPDTCALVDLVRLPVRKSGQVVARELGAATALLHAASASPVGLWVVVPPLVPTEWAEHSVAEAKRLNASWTKLDEAYATTATAAAALGVGVPPEPGMASAFAGVEEALSELSRDLLHVGVHLEKDATREGAALQRAYDGVAPGHRGGSIKDCVIAEHALAVAGLLGSDFAPRRVLLTSNVADFCVAKDDPAPRPPLDVDLLAVQMDLVTSWEWARSRLGV